MNEKRNWKIYFEWIEGKEYEQLATEFKLAKSTVKEICTSLIPLKVKSQPWQTANSYKRFREWKRSSLQEKQPTT
jgi:hypothetical protein